MSKNDFNIRTMIYISRATENNWEKLGNESCSKLTKRANKTLSNKQVTAFNYLNYSPANRLLGIVKTLNNSVGDIMYSLCLAYLRWAGILEKSNVRRYLSSLPHYKSLDISLPNELWDSREDVLGFIYQSIMSEGERNLIGLYYTNKKVVSYMLGDKVLASGETFLDPCCGSGAFLLSVKAESPTCLYGFDIDPIAVMISSTNLLVKYAHDDFVPHIYCRDYLCKDLFETHNYEDVPLHFDYIYTNPPWGADKKGVYAANYSFIKSKERASMVIYESLKRLSSKGELNFLLPTSILKIKTHSDIRKIILSSASIQRIDLFTDRFDGVYTDYFSLRLRCKEKNTQDYDVSSGQEVIHINLSKDDKARGEIVVDKRLNIDRSILEKMESRRHDDLKHSQWALGIVTGDNKNKVKKTSASGLEPLYLGKEVSPYLLKKESSYILFAPENFQQCAREEFYRAPEKLIYRFIAKYPIVAYDDKQSLCLNSANVLIPEIDGVSVKSVAALLNSTLYHYYYSMNFVDIKVLKGNLQKLPFPKLTSQQNKDLSDIVSSILLSGYSDEYQHRIDELVFSIFDITLTEQEYIRTKLQ